MQSTDRQLDRTEPKNQPTPDNPAPPAPTPGPSLKKLLDSLNAELARSGIWLVADVAVRPKLREPPPDGSVGCYLKLRTPGGQADAMSTSRDLVAHAIRCVGRRLGASPEWLASTRMDKPPTLTDQPAGKPDRRPVYEGSHVTVAVT